MKILFDQGTPVPLRRALSAYLVHTVYELGWATVQNGALLAQAEAEGFTLFITTDQNLKYQQTLAGRQLAIMVLSTTSWPRIQAHTVAILEHINAILPGDYMEIAIP
jgi:predicted nuclease of predicted toxin-antitoxin system